MIARLLALFLITPVVELALLIRLGDWIGFWPTIAIIVVTGVVGTFLARREGLSVWKRFNARLGAGDLPGRELLDGVIILVAGALLVAPGVLTDVVGILGLLPVTRALVRRRLSERLQRMASRGTAQSFALGFDFTSASGFRTGPASDRVEDTGQEEWMGEPLDAPGHRDAERS